MLIGDLLANDYGALPVGTALLQTAGNMAEILIAATLLRRVGPPAAAAGQHRRRDGRCSRRSPPA